MCDKTFNKCFVFLIDIKLKKCVTKLFPMMLFQPYMFLINIRLNKCVINMLMIVYLHKNVSPDWSLTSKMIEILFNALDTSNICSTLMKILVMLLQIIGWLFLI